MPLVSNGRIVDDAYRHVADDAPLADGVSALVSAERLLADAGAVADRSGHTGVIWPNNRPVSELAPCIDRLSLVALVFPSFRDGRAYSQARILRERYHFRGELRATGDILRDQFLFLQRTGFNVIDVRKTADALAFAEAVSRFSVFYQPASDGSLTAFRRRLAEKDMFALAPKERSLA